MKSLVLAAAALLAACAQGPDSAGKPRLGYADLTDDFAALYDSGPIDPAARAAHIRKGMEPMLPGFYDPRRFGDQSAFYEQMTESFMREYPAKREAISAAAARFGTMFDPAVADFERRIGPLPAGTPVALVVAMGEFDGATRVLGGKTHLLFGADLIAAIHGGEARAFVQHELFHVYHETRMGECSGLYCTLWQEGLAVHAAQTLNPKASDGELLLTIPEPIRPALETHRAEAVCSALRHLDTTDGKVWRAFFSGERLNERLPPRFGYLVGAWVAKDLGQTRSLANLAELDGPELRTLVESSLRGMADCH